MCGVLAVVVVVVNVEGGRGDLTDSCLIIFGGCGQQRMLSQPSRTGGHRQRATKQIPHSEEDSAVFQAID